MVILWLATTVLVEGQVWTWSKPRSQPSRYFVHVINGLSNHSCNVHCQSMDDDLGNHHLVNHGDDFPWNFEENFWGTILFLCRLNKLDVYVAFESFWPESLNRWLCNRCGNQGTCI